MPDFQTPILFLIFNRVDTTQRVFDEIKKIKPKYLYVAADGPREDKPNEKELCEQTRNIIQSIDWDCEVKTLFREQNLGCRKAVSSAIDWFFENVEEGIILEDDCLPHPDFFVFCQTLLEKYRNVPEVMHISGDNFQFGQKRGDASYYFSKIAHIWGWASWRRAWQYYDVDIKSFPDFVNNGRMKEFFSDLKTQKYWLFFFNKVYKGSNTWDYQWTYTVFKQKGYCVMPNVNLISNIGFGKQATNAYDKKNAVADMLTESIRELQHPEKMTYCNEADIFTIEKVFPITPLYKRAYHKLKKIMNLN